MIETERTILRRWKEDDAADLYRYASDSRVSEMALWPRHKSVEMSLYVLREFFIPNDQNFAIADKKTNEVIGCIGLVPAEDEHYKLATEEREIGYWIGYPLWGQGYAPEALNALLEYCKESLGLKSVVLTIDENNKASQRVADKCGFVQLDKFMLDGITTLAYRLKF